MSWASVVTASRGCTHRPGSRFASAGQRAQARVAARIGDRHAVGDEAAARTCLVEAQAQSLERAINCFLRCGTMGESRAANLLCKLAEVEAQQVTPAEERVGASPNGLRAAQIYMRAATLYEQAGDG